MSLSLKSALVSGMLVLASSTTSMAEGHSVVVELFTSQGCSSCPPADEMLRDLGTHSDVIALALHVDYWDYIGWKDIFARPQHTVRQKQYARAAGAQMIYTPQMVIGGETHVVGARPMEVSMALQKHLEQAPRLALTAIRVGDEIRVSAPAASLPDCVVQLVRYKSEETVNIARGENAGRSLTYSNIVTDWDVVGEWSGGTPLDMVVSASGNTPAVIIVQSHSHGPIVAAVKVSVAGED